MKLVIVLSCLVALAHGGIINIRKLDQAAEEGFGPTTEAAAECCGHLRGEGKQLSGEDAGTLEEFGGYSSQLPQGTLAPQSAIVARSLDLTVTISDSNDKKEISPEEPKTGAAPEQEAERTGKCSGSNATNPNTTQNSNVSIVRRMAAPTNLSFDMGTLMRQSGYALLDQVTTAEPPTQKVKRSEVECCGQANPNITKTDAGSGTRESKQLNNGTLSKEPIYETRFMRERREAKNNASEAASQVDMREMKVISPGLLKNVTSPEPQVKTKRSAEDSACCGNLNNRNNTEPSLREEKELTAGKVSNATELERKVREANQTEALQSKVISNGQMNNMTSPTSQVKVKRSAEENSPCCGHVTDTDTSEPNMRQGKQLTIEKAGNTTVKPVLGKTKREAMNNASEAATQAEMRQAKESAVGKAGNTTEPERKVREAMNNASEAATQAEMRQAKESAVGKAGNTTELERKVREAMNNANEAATQAEMRQAKESAVGKLGNTTELERKVREAMNNASEAATQADMRQAKESAVVKAGNTTEPERKVREAMKNASEAVTQAEMRTDKELTVGKVGNTTEPERKVREAINSAIKTEALQSISNVQVNNVTTRNSQVKAKRSAQENTPCCGHVSENSPEPNMREGKKLTSGEGANTTASPLGRKKREALSMTNETVVQTQKSFKSIPDGQSSNMTLPQPQTVNAKRSAQEDSDCCGHVNVNSQIESEANNRDEKGLTAGQATNTTAPAQTQKTERGVLMSNTSEAVSQQDLRESKVIPNEQLNNTTSLVLETAKVRRSAQNDNNCCSMSNDTSVESGTQTPDKFGRGLKNSSDSNACCGHLGLEIAKREAMNNVSVKNSENNLKDSNATIRDSKEFTSSNSTTDKRSPKDVAEKCCATLTGYKARVRRTAQEDLSWVALKVRRAIQLMQPLKQKIEKLLEKREDERPEGSTEPPQETAEEQQPTPQPSQQPEEAPVEGMSQEPIRDTIPPTEPIPSIPSVLTVELGSGDVSPLDQQSFSSPTHRDGYDKELVALRVHTYCTFLQTLTGVLKFPEMDHRCCTKFLLYPGSFSSLIDTPADPTKQEMPIPSDECARQATAILTTALKPITDVVIPIQRRYFQTSPAPQK